MSEINVTPMVDVMLVLLIIFMVSAPLLTVGVPIDLPQSQAKSLDQDKEPLTLSVNDKGQVFLQNAEISVDDLVPKLQAVTQARGGTDARIYVRGDKKVDYGTMMKVMGRLSAAGFHRVALVTEFEQGSKVHSDEDGVSDIDRPARGGAAVGAGVVFRQDLRGHAGGIAAGRSGQRQGILRDDQGRQERAQGREAEAAGGEDRRAEAGRKIRRPSSPRKKRSRPRRKKRRSRNRCPSPIRSPRSSRSRTSRKQAKAEPQPLPPKKPPQHQQPKFDADKIAALLDKRDPQRNAATGAELNPTPSLGTANGSAATLSQSEIDALRARLMPIAGIRRSASQRRRNQFRSLSAMRFKRDGTLSAAPQVLASGTASPFGPALATAPCARSCSASPSRCCGPSTTSSWKDMEITFDPQRHVRRLAETFATIHERINARSPSIAAR